MILTTERLQQLVPSAFATEHHNSAKYLQIPTARIIDAMASNGFHAVKANQMRKIDPADRAFARHVIRFRQQSTVNQIQVNDVIPEIVLLNSHDGTSAYKMMLGIFRLVCSNGLIVADSTLASIRVRHSGNASIIQDLLRGANDLSAQGTKVIDVINTWKQRGMEEDKRLDYARGALAIYNPENDKGIDPRELIIPRRGADQGRDLWSTFNVVQEKLTRGLFWTRTHTGRRHARAISSIDRDLKLNRALWQYTEEFKNN